MMYAHRAQSSEPVRGAFVPALGWQAGFPAELSGRFKASERHCPKKQGDGLARWLQQVRALAVPAW